MNNVNEEYNSYLYKILSDENSLFKNSRAGGTIANSGLSMKFDLSQGFPLINTKDVFYRGFIHEMVHFMHGPQNDGNLHVDYFIDNKCNFWNKDVFNFYLKKKGIKYDSIDEFNKNFILFEEKLKNDPEFRKKNGIMGRPYGAQWRDWKSNSGVNIDQLANAFEEIKNHSDSRRIIVEAWRPDELSEMALPPCHKTFQFMVMGDRLDIIMYQRSADSFLGVPFNIGEYGLMGLLGAKYAGLKPGIFTHQIADAHIYCGVEEKAKWYQQNFDILREKIKTVKNREDFLTIKEWIDNNSTKPKEEYKEEYDHVTAVLEQMSRDPNKYPTPQLEVIIDENLSAKELLDTLKFENFKVKGYKDNHYPKIIRQMSTG
ncbi:MAG: thymidylate synthase [Candidatus Nanoarchaeia archaeon]|nr:thymidylate synthase [Candidatus Nanoarchaeia archaeon]